MIYNPDLQPCAQLYPTEGLSLVMCLSPLTQTHCIHSERISNVSWDRTRIGVLLLACTQACSSEMHNYTLSFLRRSSFSHSLSSKTFVNYSKGPGGF